MADQYGYGQDWSTPLISAFEKGIGYAQKADETKRMKQAKVESAKQQQYDHYFKLKTAGLASPEDDLWARENGFNEILTPAKKTPVLEAEAESRVSGYNNSYGNVLSQKEITSLAKLYAGQPQEIFDLGVSSAIKAKAAQIKEDTNNEKWNKMFQAKTENQIKADNIKDNKILKVSDGDANTYNKTYVAKDLEPAQKAGLYKQLFYKRLPEYEGIKKGFTHHRRS